MLLRICELALTILSNLLVMLNKSKTKNTSDENGSVDLREVLKEIRRIEEDRKRIGKDDDSIRKDMCELNDRLKNIESILYEKRTNLLKEKIINEQTKEDGG